MVIFHRPVKQIMRQTTQYEACICGIKCIYEVVLHSVNEICQNWEHVVAKMYLHLICCKHDQRTIYSPWSAQTNQWWEAKRRKQLGDNTH